MWFHLSFFEAAFQANLLTGNATTQLVQLAGGSHLQIAEYTAGILAALAEKGG